MGGEINKGNLMCFSFGGAWVYTLGLFCASIPVVCTTITPRETPDSDDLGVQAHSIPGSIDHSNFLFCQ